MATALVFILLPILMLLPSNKPKTLNAVDAGDIPPVWHQDENGMIYAEFGEYPQTYVGDELNTRLNTLYEQYTQSPDNSPMKKSFCGREDQDYARAMLDEAGLGGEEFWCYSVSGLDEQINGRYARGPQLPHDGVTTYSTGDAIGEANENKWFKIEPIKWFAVSATDKNFFSDFSSVSFTNVVVMTDLILTTAYKNFSNHWHGYNDHDISSWEEFQFGDSTGINNSIYLLEQNLGSDDYGSTYASYCPPSAVELEKKFKECGGLIKEPEAFNEKLTHAKVSDYAKAVYSKCDANDYGEFYTRNVSESNIITVGADGYHSYTRSEGSNAPKDIGYRPCVCLQYDAQKEYKPGDTEQRFGLTWVYDDQNRWCAELGEYPQTWVGAELNATLEAEYAKMGDGTSQLSETGKNYALHERQQFEENETIVQYDSGVEAEYEYDGNRYVRSIQYIYESADSQTQYASGLDAGNSNEARWFKVEPILWYPVRENKNPLKYRDDEDIEMVAKNGIASYIPFAETPYEPEYDEYIIHYNESFIYNWLTSEFFTSSGLNGKQEYRNGGVLRPKNLYLNDFDSSNYINEYIYLNTRNNIQGLQGYNDGVFSSNSVGKCAIPTDYAVAHGAYGYNWNVNQGAKWATASVAQESKVYYISSGGGFTQDRRDDFNTVVRPFITIMAPQNSQPEPQGDPVYFEDLVSENADDNDIYKVKKQAVIEEIGESFEYMEFHIKSADGLRKISDFTNNTDPNLVAGYSQTVDLVKFVLDNDIDLQNVPFKSIANDYYLAKGITTYDDDRLLAIEFDGQGHTIRGLKQSCEFGGLFAKYASTAHDLNLIVDISSTGSAGGFCAWSEGAGLTNINVQGSISANGFADATESEINDFGLYVIAAGGLVGVDIGGCALSNCSVQADVSAIGTAISLGAAGGLVGLKYNEYPNTIESCFVTSQKIESNFCSGGLIGFNLSILICNQNYVSVEKLVANPSITYGDCMVGGLIGNNWYLCKVSDCEVYVGSFEGNEKAALYNIWMTITGDVQPVLQANNIKVTSKQEADLLVMIAEGMAIDASAMINQQMFYAYGMYIKLGDADAQTFGTFAPSKWCQYNGVPSLRCFLWSGDYSPSADFESA